MEENDDTFLNIENRIKLLTAVFVQDSKFVATGSSKGYILVHNDQKHAKRAPGARHYSETWKGF